MVYAVLFALLAGVFTTIETSINSTLGKYITPSIETLHSLAVGFIFIFLISMARGAFRVIVISFMWVLYGSRRIFWSIYHC